MTQQRVSPISVTSVLPAVPVLSLQAALGQSANIQEWRNSSGTVLASISSAGLPSFPNVIVTGSTIPANGVYLPAANTLGFATNSAVRMQIDANGNVGIGVTPVAAYGIYLSKNNTGGTVALGMFSNGPVQSDVTSEFRNFQSSAVTAASSFTLAGYSHFYAFQSSIGAGSAITNQYAFRAASSLTGATNNYGFKGEIASGTNRYNIYMDGTADNYLAGKLLIGNATANASSTLNRALQIEGTSATTQGIAVIRNTNDTTGTGLFFAKSRGTALGGVTAVQSGDNLAIINASGADGTTMNTSIAQIDFSVDGTVSTGVIPTRIGFTTEATNGNISERARITSGGLLLINTTSAVLGSGSVPSQIGIVSNAATTVGAVIRGAASQTANLQEWQNSAGTVLSNIGASGALTLSGVPDQVTINSSDSNGTVLRFTSTATNGRTWRIGHNFVVGSGEFSLYDNTAAAERLNVSNTGNFGFNGRSYGSGTLVMFIANATTVPSTNPTGGGVLYVEAGALKYRGSSGTVTTIANA